VRNRKVRKQRASAPPNQQDVVFEGLVRGPKPGREDWRQKTNFGGPQHVASTLRYSSHVGLVLVRFAAASRVATSTISGFEVNSSARKSSGVCTCAANDLSASTSKSYKLFVTST